MQPCNYAKLLLHAAARQASERARNMAGQVTLIPQPTYQDRPTDSAGPWKQLSWPAPPRRAELHAPTPPIPSLARAARAGPLTPGPAECGSRVSGLRSHESAKHPWYAPSAHRCLPPRGRGFRRNTPPTVALRLVLYYFYCSIVPFISREAGWALRCSAAQPEE